MLYMALSRILRDWRESELDVLPASVLAGRAYDTLLTTVDCAEDIVLATLWVHSARRD